jgi:transposase InsO family protein
VRYQFIEEHRGQFSITAMARVLEVSTSGYYRWRGREESRRSKFNRRLLVEIKAVHAKSDATYGSPRVYRELQARGITCGENRVARLMRLNDVRAKQMRRYKATTDSKHNLPVADNHLDRQFDPAAPNRAWAADITFIWTREGWLYVAVVMDLFSRRIIGWSMQSRLKRKLVIDALKMAMGAWRVTDSLLCHSDQGSQYASGDYQKLLADASITCSMSRKGDCWDNAPVESFFATLKRERVSHRRYETRVEARRDLFQYMESWYNRKRLHSSLKYLSLADYEEQQASRRLPMAA